MNMQKKYLAALAVLACMTSASAALAAPIDAVPDQVKGDAGIQMNRMRNYMERERVKRQIAEDRAASKNKVEGADKAASQQGEAITFELKKIVMDSSAVLTEAELAAITQPYEGKMVQLNDIYAIVE